MTIQDGMRWPHPTLLDAAGVEVPGAAAAMSSGRVPCHVPFATGGSLTMSSSEVPGAVALTTGSDYKIVPEAAVPGYLDQGYDICGSPAWDPINKSWVQGVIKRPPALRSTWVGTCTPAHLGGVRPAVDLSDVSLELVDQRVFDRDGVELRVGDEVDMADSSKLSVGVVQIDPIFSRIQFADGQWLPSTDVRFGTRPPAAPVHARP